MELTWLIATVHVQTSASDQRKISFKKKVILHVFEPIISNEFNFKGCNVDELESSLETVMDSNFSTFFNIKLFLNFNVHAIMADL